MSQYPFPEDIFAVARQDWCRSMDLSQGGAVAQLVCSDLARQCGSFTNATKDRQRIARTAPQLQELLKTAEIERWAGKCPIVQAEGVCNLGGAQSYQEQLWGAFGQARQDATYRNVAGVLEGGEAEGGEAEGGDAEGGDAEGARVSGAQQAVFASAAVLRPERQIAFNAAKLNANPRRVVNDYQLLGLPFLP